MARDAIPYGGLKTLFLDAGNTLVAIDLAFVRAELAARGVACELGRLRRAEAAARPVVSAALRDLRSTETIDAFELYVRGMLAGARLAPRLDAADLEALAREIVPVLDALGRVRLWSSVLPDVPDTLAAFRARGLRLVVVSNSDGTVEELLTRQGLRGFFEAVVDSRHVGYEKPDPRIFQHALRVARASSATTLHVGDMYDTDVLGARAAGLHALLLDPYGDWPEADCERAPDLGALLDRIGDR